MNARDWFTVLIVFAISDTFGAIIGGLKLLRLHFNRLTVFIGVLLIGEAVDGLAFMLSYPYRPHDVHYPAVYVGINIIGRIARTIGVWALVLFLVNVIRRNGSPHV